MSTRDKLLQIYDVLFKKFGRQKWWPADSPFEVMVGAILTQNTNWPNVEKAIANLKAASVMDAALMLSLPDAQLAALIKPAGYLNIKTKRLKNFLRFFIDEFDASVPKMKLLSLSSARERLLSVKGIGPETADAILLYALDKPMFVCDTYTYRLCSRHSLLDECASYDELQVLFMENLPHDVELFNEYHALIVRVGKEFCKPTPQCDECPLKSFL